MEPVVKRRKEEPRKHKQGVDDEGKEQPSIGQSPVSSSTINQAKVIQLTPCKIISLPMRL